MGERFFFPLLFSFHGPAVVSNRVPLTAVTVTTVGCSMKISAGHGERWRTAMGRVSRVMSQVSSVAVEGGRASGWRWKLLAKEVAYPGRVPGQEGGKAVLVKRRYGFRSSAGPTGLLIQPTTESARRCGAEGRTRKSASARPVQERSSRMQLWWNIFTVFECATIFMRWCGLVLTRGHGDRNRVGASLGTPSAEQAEGHGAPYTRPSKPGSRHGRVFPRPSQYQV